MKLVCLNLSGNPITRMKDVPKLASLKNLRWLIFSDPLCRHSPVTFLANFRQFAIHSLPLLEKLDLIQITDTERKNTTEFYESKLRFYRLTLYDGLARNQEAQKAHLEAIRLDFELIWSALHNQGPQAEKQYGEKCSNSTYWEAESLRWKDRRRLSLYNYKKLAEIIKQKTELELEYSGNLRFEEIDPKEKFVTNNLKKKMDSFICAYISGKTSGVRLLNVWSIVGPYRTTIKQSQFKETFDEVFILKPVRNLSTELLQFVEEFLFGVSNKNLVVANCLPSADSLVEDVMLVHRQLLLRALSLLDSRMVLLCGVVGGTDLFKHEQTGDCPHHSSQCRSLAISDPSRVVPLYLVHFQYLFQDYFKPLKVPPNPPFSQSLSSLSVWKKCCPTQDLQNITKLILCNSNLYQLDFPVMEHVTVADFSYNYLQDVSTIGKLFPKLAYLNLTFNRVCNPETLQNMKGLTHLVLKWNLLTNYLGTLRKLKELNSLRHLDLSWNPFTDVVSDGHKHFLICRTLQSLLTYNGLSLPHSKVLGQVPQLNQNQFPKVPVYHRSSHTLTLKWKAEMSSLEEKNHLGVSNGKIVSATLCDLKLTQLRTNFSLQSLKWLDLSHNLITSAADIKGLLALQELNLSFNAVDNFLWPHGKFKYLKRLNLSHNYLSSLTAFSAQTLPHLKLLDLSNNYIQTLVGLSAAKSLVELYLSHNLVQNCETLVHCKACKELRVLDLSYNPVTTSTTFRLSCLHYLSGLKYINGCSVKVAELKSAMALYGGLLDKDYLAKVYSEHTLMNLTNLDLAKCSINKVSLPDVTMANVKSITLDHNNITCLSWVSAFPNLSILSLSNNQVRTFLDKPSSSSTKPPHHSGLQCVLLDHNRIRNLEPLQLALFPELQVLTLSNNEISSLAGLLNNGRLEHLILDKNKLDAISIKHTEKLQNLVGLHLERNSIMKLDFLRPLKKLQKFFIGFNKILTKSCLAHLSDLPELRELTIHGNPICRRDKSYKDVLPDLPNLSLLEGHPVNRHQPDDSNS